MIYVHYLSRLILACLHLHSRPSAPPSSASLHVVPSRAASEFHRPPLSAHRLYPRTPPNSSLIGHLLAQPRPSSPVLARPRPSSPVLTRPRPSPVIARPRPSSPVFASFRPSSPFLARPRPSSPAPRPAPRPSSPVLARSSPGSWQVGQKSRIHHFLSSQTKIAHPQTETGVVSTSPQTPTSGAFFVSEKCLSVQLEACWKGSTYTRIKIWPETLSID